MELVPSPFHPGEQEVQSRYGVRQSAESLGQRMVRDSMPEQHREFYQQLPLMFLGALDDSERPWAIPLFGEPGFAVSPDPYHLDFHHLGPAHRPLNDSLRPGTSVGLLGVELHTRRRNRMNGVLSELGEGSMRVKVEQAFGNCPQYIHKRVLQKREMAPAILEQGKVLSEAASRLVAQADTFFIATSYSGQGADVSHRGGRPGFVKVVDHENLVFPDFRGNNHFNTIGNLVKNPKAGLLFLDFEEGSVLYLTVSVEIVWEGPELESFQGAQRLLRLKVEEYRLVRHSLPFRWSTEEMSPSVLGTGSWEEETGLRDYRVERVVEESPEIKSFYLKPSSGALPTYEAGQYLKLQLSHPDGVLERPYSLSCAPNREFLRITVKKDGLGSTFLHEHVREGDHLKASLPAGEFVLEKSRRPVVLLSAGVGLTPMISMLQAAIEQNRRVYFLHGARDGEHQILAPEIEKMSAPNVTLHYSFSRPKVGDEFDHEGRIDKELLRSVLPLDDYEVYLCGPAPFLSSTRSALLELGLRPERIRWESFGGVEPELEEAENGPLEVEFARSGKTVSWTKGSLLSLAEENGIEAAFSCRSGACGTCRVRKRAGRVSYRQEVLAELGPGEILPCVARPEPESEETLVLEL